jgi:hypothetical protein
MASNSPSAVIHHVNLSPNHESQTSKYQSIALAMAPPAAGPTEATKLDISSLMSPPDVVLDNFGQVQPALSTRTPSALATMKDSPSSSRKQPLPMSPPVSPYRRASSSSHADGPATPFSTTLKDPLLYPHDDNGASSPPQAPLFASTELDDHRRIVDDHLRARSPSIFGGVAPPRLEDYALALSFRSQVMKHFMANRRGWLRKERALLEADRRAGGNRYHTIMPAKPIASKLAPSSRSNRTVDRVSKPQPAPRTIRVGTSGGIGATIGPARQATGPRRVSATPEPSSRRIVAPNREDKDFNSLPNYCPPLDSLPNRPSSLRVDWKGQPIDLSGDPHAHLLHPDELALAGNLRLDCATYLTSKRRIFERRLQCLRTGKEFRKTDAQQACKIDVNKASKLWTAFDKVGWLDASWVRRYL